MCCRSARHFITSWQRRGVRVTVLCPGPVPTEFQARAGIPRVPFPRTGMPRVVGSNALTCTAEEVAEAGYEGLMRGRRVVVPGFANKAVTTASTRLLPRRFVLEAVAHSQLVRGGGPTAFSRRPYGKRRERLRSTKPVLVVLHQENVDARPGRPLLPVARQSPWISGGRATAIPCPIRLPTMSAP